MLFMAAVQSEAILIIIIVGCFVFFPQQRRQQSRFSSIRYFSLSLAVTLYTRLMLALFSPQQHAQYAQGTSASGT